MCPCAHRHDRSPSSTIQQCIHIMIIEEMADITFCTKQIQLLLIDVKFITFNIDFGCLWPISIFDRRRGRGRGDGLAHALCTLKY